MKKKIMVGVLFWSASTFAQEENFQCRGDFKNSNQIFRYSLTVNGAVARSRLTLFKGERLTKEFAWKKYVSTTGKIIVDSPWAQHRAYLVPSKTVYELVLVDPATDTQLTEEPYSRFYCVKFLP